MYNDIIFYLNLEHIRLKIDSVEFVKTEQGAEYHIFLKDNRKPCPICNFIKPNIKEYKTKSLLHSVSNNSKCFIIYHARRYICPKCKHTFFEDNPLSLEFDKVSIYTVFQILEKLRQFTRTFKSVANDLFISEQSVIRIFQSHVNVKRKKLPKVLCIDEIYTSKLSKSKYAAVLLDFESRSIVDIIKSRKINTLDSYFSKIPLEERNKVDYVCIDMWEPYKSVAERLLKNAKIAVDSFHVIKHINDAVNSIRIDVMNKFDNKQDDIDNNHFYYIMLKRCHFFFTKTFDNLDYEKKIYIKSLRTKLDKIELRKYLLDIDEKLTFAYNLKERYCEFNSTCKYEEFDNEFYDIVEDFFKSKYKIMHEVGRMLLNWKVEIKNSFIRINNSRISNGPIEGMNSKIKIIFKSGNGYSNFELFRNRAMYSLNKNEAIRIDKPKKEKNK